MTYSKRIPPIKIKVDIRGYNFLVEILSIHAERDNERLAKKSSKLKDKLEIAQLLLKLLLIILH